MSEATETKETKENKKVWKPEHTPGSTVIASSDLLVLPSPQDPWYQHDRQTRPVDPELVKNMVKFGFTSAIIAVERESFDHPGTSELVVIAGRGRTKAAWKADHDLTKAGKPPLEIPVIIAESASASDIGDQLLISLSENELRTGNTPMGLAKQMQAVINARKEAVWPRDEAGNKVPYLQAKKVVDKAQAQAIKELMITLGKSDAFVYKHIGLLNLAASIQTELIQNPELPVEQLIIGEVHKLGTPIAHTGEFVPDEVAQREKFEKIFPAMKAPSGEVIKNEKTAKPERTVTKQADVKAKLQKGEGFRTHTAAELKNIGLDSRVNAKLREFCLWAAGELPDYEFVRNNPTIEKSVQYFGGPDAFIGVKPEDAPDFVMPEAFDPVKRDEEASKARKAEAAKKEADRKAKAEAKEVATKAEQSAANKAADSAKAQSRAEAKSGKK